MTSSTLAIKVESNQLVRELANKKYTHHGFNVLKRWWCISLQKLQLIITDSIDIRNIGRSSKHACFSMCWLATGLETPFHSMIKFLSPLFPPPLPSSDCLCLHLHIDICCIYARQLHCNCNCFQAFHHSLRTLNLLSVGVTLPGMISHLFSC